MLTPNVFWPETINSLKVLLTYVDAFLSQSSCG